MCGIPTLCSNQRFVLNQRVNPKIFSSVSPGVHSFCAKVNDPTNIPTHEVETPSVGNLAPCSVFELSLDNWDERVINDSQRFPVIVECYGNGGTDEEVRSRNALHVSLAKHVKQQNLELTMGRLNVLEVGSLAQDLGVTQIPTVLMVFQGSIINQFIGIPEDVYLKPFVETGMRAKYGLDIERIQSAGDEFLKEGNLPEARKAYSDLLYTERFKSQALGLAGLASCSLKDGQVAEAQQAMDIVKNSYPEYMQHPLVQRIFSQIELSKQSVTSEDASALLRKIEADPNDFQSRYDLAVQYVQKEQFKLGFDQLFEIIKKNKEWNEQAARVFLLKTFSSMDQESDELSRARKRLNSLWYA